MKPTRTQAENAVLFKRSEQAAAWSRAGEAIREYLILYGVNEERASGAAVDLLDNEINEIIEEEGE